MNILKHFSTCWNSYQLNLHMKIYIRTICNVQQCCSVMLVITADRQKLLSYVLFKWKTMAKDKFFQRIKVQVQESQWTTVHLAENWINSI
jgi:hypothetical protein